LLVVIVKLSGTVNATPWVSQCMSVCAERLARVQAKKKTGKHDFKSIFIFIDVRLMMAQR